MADDEGRKRLGERIDRLRREKGLTLSDLALKALLDERTLRNIIKGQSVKPKTLRAICDAVGLEIAKATAPDVRFADDRLGGYSNKAIAKYEGYYCAYRRAYDRSSNLMRTVFHLAWCDESSALRFSEHQKYTDKKTGKLLDFSQDGEVFASEDTGLIHLLTVANGRLRLITLTRLPGTALRVAVLTQSHMSFYQQPAVSPVLLLKMSDRPDATQVSQLIGDVAPGDADYDEISRQLVEVEREVVMSTFSAGPPRRRREDFFRGEQPDADAPPIVERRLT